jgi:peptide/nickel transport system substrate-binding protein
MAFARGRRALVAVGGLAASSLALAGCAAGSGTASVESLIVGTSDQVVSLDPAGSYDNGSFAVQNQVFAFLLNSPTGSPDVKPDLAKSASFTDPKTYTVELKPDLKFQNGNDLTASDVKFSFERELKINNPNGPQSLLANLESIETKGDTTVVFHLKHADQTWPQVLSSPAGPIVDEEVFSPTKLTPAATIVKGKAFDGQYGITSYKENQLVQYAKNDQYKGLLGAPKTDEVTGQYFTKETDLKLAVQKGDVDVAYRSLTPTDIASLAKRSNLTVHYGPGGEIRYLVFNLKTQPFGTGQPDADAKKALAVRQAVADVLDRKALAEDVYKGTFTPLYSSVPDGLTGAATPLKSLYGDGNGGPSVDKAKQRLKDAGVTGKVSLKIQYSPDHYGETSDDEYALIKSQLENSGLFDVDIQSTLYTTYSPQRVKDAYPEYQLGWFPDFSDADNYLSPFYTKDNFVANHYDDKQVQDLISQEQAENDKAKRAEVITEIQKQVAEDLPTLQFLQGRQVVVAGKDVKGVALDASFKFRFASLTK